MIKSHILLTAIAVPALLSIGCGKKTKEGDSGLVKIEFAKKDGSALGNMSLMDATEGWVSGTDLTTLKIKPISVSISESNDSGYMIWGSKNCLGEEHERKIDDKEYKYFVPNVCSANSDDDYLNMLDPNALNTTLNSQAWPVPPGAYKYVKIVFCSESKSDTVKNLAYKAPGMEQDHEVTFCDPFIGYNEAGVSVAEGGAVTIKLAYDLDKLIDSLTHSPDMPEHETGAWTNGCYWVDDTENQTQVQYCPKFGQSALVPSIK